MPSDDQQNSHVTSLSLLHGIRQQDQQQWDRFVTVYSPIVYAWCRRARVSEHDSADILQEVFQAVAVNIDSFRRERPEDSFHGWLWRITRNKVNDHFRKKLKAPQAQGGSTAQALIHEIPVQFPNEPTTEDQERDHAAISRRILRLLEQDFEPRTWKAFWRVAVDEVPAKSAAEELNMTVGAVYNAKYKVLCRLRQELDGIA